MHALSAAGAELHALVRATSRTAELEALGVALHRGGFDSPDGLRSACEGAEFVVHAAGGGKVEAIEQMYAQNRDTTSALLEAAASAAPNLERFVFVSSAAAHGPSTPDTPARETDPPAPRSHYGKAKREAEKLVLGPTLRAPVTILRPPAVYGPGDTRMVGLFAAAKRGFFPRLAGGPTSMIHVEDLVQAILRALTVPHEPGRTYFVSDGEAYTHARIGAALEAAFGRSALPVPVPAWALRGAARLSEAYASRTGRPTFLNRDKVEDLLAPSWLVDPSLAQRELGFTPHARFEDGARTTARWYESEGWL